MNNLEVHTSTGQVVLGGHLPFGSGVVGRECAQNTPQEQAEFGTSLNPFVRQLTVFNTADCVEDRPVVQVGDATDPEIIACRIACRLPGGFYLPVIKAAAAAELAFLGDAKDFKDAYEKGGKVLDKFGYEDAGHENCGASIGLESSIAQEVPEPALLAALPALTETNERTRHLLNLNRENKRKKLADGFYGGWSSDWHADHLAEKSPRHFSRLAKAPGGKPVQHEARGLLVVTKTGYGFATTDFHHRTGNMAFAITPQTALIYDVANKICGGDAEKSRFLLEIQGADPAGVLNGLAAKGMPVFTDGAEG